LSACDGDTSNAALNPPAPAATKAPAGYFEGYVYIDGTQYTGEGLVSADGLIRLRLHGTDIVQFAGSGQIQDGEFVGSGFVTSEDCGGSSPGTLCSARVPGTISARLNRPEPPIGLRGTIGFDAPDVPTTATILMTASGWSTTAGTLHQWSSIAEGLYDITPAQDLRTAASSALGDATLSLDAEGRLFFQSPSSGCAGNGTLNTHSVDIVNTYDVAVSIAGCSEPFAMLNGEFEGLATGVLRDFGDFELEGWEHWLISWLTSIDPSSPAAITIEAKLL